MKIRTVKLFSILAVAILAGCGTTPSLPVEDGSINTPDGSPADHLADKSRPDARVGDDGQVDPPDACLGTCCLPKNHPQANKTLSISENKILLDGKPFVAKGVIMVATVAPANATGVSPFVATARKHFGASQFDAAKAWGVNTIRLHASQPALDPQSPLYNKTYLDDLYDAAKLALAKGFIVIIDMQAEVNSGATVWTRMPTAETKRAWNRLVPLFSNCGRVMYELFNEPALFETETNWSIWLNGGYVPASNGHPAVTAIGAQELTNYLRDKGAKNVLIADGLFYGRSLNVKKVITDPLNKMAYGVHPFFTLEKDLGVNPNISPETVWHQRWGAMSEVYPVIATAWSSHHLYPAACLENAEALSIRFLAALKKYKVGVVGWAFDIPGTLISDWQYTPTTFEKFSCSVEKSGGAGKLLQSHFQN